MWGVDIYPLYVPLCLSVCVSVGTWGEGWAGSSVLNPTGVTREGVVSSGPAQERGVFLRRSKAPAWSTPSPPGSDYGGIKETVREGEIEG